MLYNVYIVEGLEFLYIKTMNNEMQALLFAAKIGGLVIEEDNEYINTLKRKATRQQDNYIDAGLDDYIDNLNRQQRNSNR